MIQRKDIIGKFIERNLRRKNIDFKSQIEPSIYIFVNPQNGSISKQNIKPANSNNSLKRRSSY